MRAMLARSSQQFQVGPDRVCLSLGSYSGRRATFLSVPGSQSDDRRHNDAPFSGQSLNDRVPPFWSPRPRRKRASSSSASARRTEWSLLTPTVPRAVRRGPRPGFRPPPRSGPVELGQVVEARPGTADHRERKFYRFSSRGQIASFQSEQGCRPQGMEVEVVAVEMKAAGRGEGIRSEGARLFQGPFEEGGLADHSGQRTSLSGALTCAEASTLASRRASLKWPR